MSHSRGRWFWRLGLRSLGTLLPAVCLAQVPGTYRIDSQASHIEIHVFRGGLLGGLGDNHQIVLGRFSGTAEALEGSRWKVEVQAEAASLKAIDPGLSESSRQEVQRTMLGPTQLDVERYPAIRLQSVSLAGGERSKTWLLQADLTLHGITRKVEFPLTWNQNGNRLRVSGKTNLRLRDFRIEPIRKAFGSIQVRNEFEVIYDMELDLVPAGYSNHQADRSANRLVVDWARCRMADALAGSSGRPE